MVLSASDVDGDALTYTLSSDASNGSVAIEGLNATYTPSNNFNGSDNFTFSVSDGQLSATAEITLNVEAVNDPPELISEISNMEFDEDDPNDDSIDLSTIFFDIEDGTNLTYTRGIEGSLNNIVDVSISGSSIIIDFLPHRYGSGNITIEATDSEEGSISDTFHIIVHPVNDVPDITNIPVPDDSIELGEIYEWLIDPTGTDIDDSQFDVTMHTDPASGSESIVIDTEVNELFTFLWTPTAQGLHNLAITITDRNSTGGDNGEQSDIYSWTVNVVEESTNIPPVIQDIENTSIDEDLIFEVPLVITDLDPDDNIETFTVNVYDEYLAHSANNTQN